MSADLQSVISTVGDLPPMPLVAVKVMELLQDENTDSEKLAETISRDQGVSARIMKIANSSFYSLRRQVKTLEHAIVILGERTLRSLVLAASLKGLNKSFGLMEKMLWEDSIGCAIAARLLAERTRCADPEEAFLAGLFRHIGKMVMNMIDGPKFRQVVEASYNGEGTLDELETQYFPFNHTLIGAAVVEKWNFSENLTQVILHHEDLGLSEEDDPALYRLAATVNLADAFCLRLGIGQRGPDESVEIAQCPGAKALGPDAGDLDALLEEFRESFEADRDAFLD